MRFLLPFAMTINIYGATIGSGNCDPLSQPATKQDLVNLEQNILMKLSQVKTIITEAAAKNVEAFAEIAALVALLNAQLATAIENAADPEVTDEAFLATLADLQGTATQLADIVPNPEPEVPAEPAPVEPTPEAPSA